MQAPSVVIGLCRPLISLLAASALAGWCLGHARAREVGSASAISQRTRIYAGTFKNSVIQERLQRAPRVSREGPPGASRQRFTHDRSRLKEAASQPGRPGHAAPLFQFWMAEND